MKNIIIKFDQDWYSSKSFESYSQEELNEFMIALDNKYQELIKDVPICNECR